MMGWIITLIIGGVIGWPEVVARGGNFSLDMNLYKDG